MVVSLAACQPGIGSSPGRSAPASLTVYAAASLKAVMAAIEASYEPAHPGTGLMVSTDSSSALEAKIEQGAPADVFLAADSTNPQKLADKGLASGDVVTFARNRLTLIVPVDNPAGIASPADLAKPGVKVIAAEDTVPITHYANELVQNLARETGYPTGFAEAYAVNVVSREDNVAAVVSKVELGEGDAGIAYVTDAKTSTKVRAIPVPDNANVSATYGGVVVKTTTDAAAATAFVTWLTGAEGQAIFASFGFIHPS
jgi:molybdate transport system substrate-binding protein